MSQDTQNVSENLENLKADIERLAKLPRLTYELERQQIADKFNIRVSSIDDAIKDLQPAKDTSAGGTIIFPQVDPWPEKVNAANLLSELTRTIKKFITLGEHEALTTALWIMFTHCFDGASVSPLLYICSPEKRCGKSTLLSLIERLICRPLPAANITAAATFRVVEAYKPTLLLDEVDTFINDKNSELAGIINSGHTRSQAFVLRCTGDDQEVRSFSTWCPKCLAGIGGTMPDTTRDRSIFIKLRRKLKDDGIEKIRHANKGDILNLQRQCARFAIDNPDIYKSMPAIPKELNDRAADNWEHLLQIAAIAGDDWFKKATDAALAISGINVEQENKSLGIELLEDIQNILDGKYKNASNITTDELIKALCVDEEGPWVTINKYGNDPQITARQLSSLLKPYGISSTNLTRGRERPKGYSKSAFKDAFSRYMPSYTTDFSATAATTVIQMPQPCGLQSKNGEKAHLLPPRYHTATSEINIQKNDNRGSDIVADDSGYEKNTTDPSTPGRYGESSGNSDKNIEEGTSVFSDEIVENTAEGYIEV